jgi:SAM-dependent methyltransferase
MTDSSRDARLTALFGETARSAPGEVRVGDRRYPVIDDVILLLPSERLPGSVRRCLGAGAPAPARGDGGFAPDVQASFGEEWKTYGSIVPEHADEFQRYFDLVDLKSLNGKRVVDLGCGMGRWAHYLAPHCREMVLVDFSEAIFVARRNLRRRDNVLFFMGDVTDLPFHRPYADFLYSLGVLHHLPSPCLEAVRRFKGAAPRQLFFIYYALDNRRWHYRALLVLVTACRWVMCRVRNQTVRVVLAKAIARWVYRPLIRFGSLLKRWGWESQAPLYDFYHDKSLARIEQDVYDRFFTRLEQRVSRRDINALKDTFPSVTISSQLPYWHFLVESPVDPRAEWRSPD